ncbi:hypothetical protein RUM43_008270 [Polyplax serrata]|uniref:Uncharacterized protein n=1 Tax=Polyplax serrata TaxID=468196 RepID=A0AAN8S2B9_POLSC
MSQNEKEIHKLKSACIRPFLEINITINGTHYVVVGKNSWMHKAHFNITIIDYHACKRTVQSFVEQLEKPESFKGKPFYAVRDYFTLALSTGLVSRPGGNVTMQKIEKKARDVCHDNTLEPFTCMDIIYMHSLFKKVYGLRKKSIIHFCEEVNGFDVDWRLAKAFSLYKGYNISSIDPVWHPDVLCPALKAKNSTTELNPTTTKPHLTIKHKQIKH